MVDIIDGGITTPQGFKAAGVHSGVKYRSLDLGLLYSEVPAKAYCAFTSNNVKAAPVQVMMEENSPTLSAVVVNSGNANALTGRRGIEDAYAMKQAVAAELNLDPKEVGVMSTGLIGRFLDMHKIRYGISRASRELDAGRESDKRICEAIMTTDTIKKECAVRTRLSDGTLVYIAAISKGSGMISPHMKVLHGTTLSLITTDATLGPDFAEVWQSVLDDTMNMVTVDGDQSTNDTCILLANGMSKSAPADHDPEFEAALRTVMTRIARTIAMDGEGASKLIEVQVTGAETHEDAVKVVRAITNSPLVKTAIFGHQGGRHGGPHPGFRSAHLPGRARRGGRAHGHGQQGGQHHRGPGHRQRVRHRMGLRPDVRLRPHQRGVRHMRCRGWATSTF